MCSKIEFFAAGEGLKFLFESSPVKSSTVSGIAEGDDGSASQLFHQSSPRLRLASPFSSEEI